MDTLEKWFFDEELYTSREYLECLDIELNYINGDFQLLLEIPYNPWKDTYKYYYTVSFPDFVSMRVTNIYTNGELQYWLGHLLEQFHMEYSCPGVFRCKGTDYIRWLAGTNIYGGYPDSPDDLTQYLFITQQQIIEVVIENNDLPTVQKMQLPINERPPQSP